MALARASSGALAPVGRYGVAVKASSSACLASIALARASCTGTPLSAQSITVASESATRAAAGLNRSPPAGGERTITAAVPATEASHHPSRRSGIMPSVPAEAAGSTYASSAPLTPAAAFGPHTPAKKTANATGRVTSAASAVAELTAVPIAISALPAIASARCAISFSRRVPPKDTSTSVANPPNAANVAICRLPSTWSANANRPGTTIAARTARSAAGTDHTGRQLAAAERQLDDPPVAVADDTEAPSGTVRV